MSEYKPYDGFEWMQATETELLLNKNYKLLKRNGELARDLGQNKASLKRATEMIERLCNVLADCDHPDDSLVKEARIYLNILTYGTDELYKVQDYKDGNTVPDNFYKEMKKAEEDEVAEYRALKSRAAKEKAKKRKKK